jgi:cytidylate kinase
MIIAIDGPAGSGKSSVAKIVAGKLKCLHIDSGAMYRAVAWKAQQLEMDLADHKKVAEMTGKLNIKLIPSTEKQTILVDGQDITGFLKNEIIGRDAATVASQKAVREILVAKQQAMGRDREIVMDGRDIGTVVFPNADRKFFLDADPGERGLRRYKELKNKTPDVDLDSIIEQVKKRDEEDKNRKVSPLKKAADAVLIDTTHLNIDEVVNQIMQLIESPEKT